MSVQEVQLRLATSTGENRAAINLRGGGLRELTVDGADLVESYPAGSQPPHSAGAVLFPWPNRVRDGRWSQHGVVHQLAVNEPELGNAAHGLVREATFVVEAATPHDVTLRAAVLPQPGYPFAVELRVTYELTRNGIHVRHQVVNSSGSPAPVCMGVHPYLRVGATPTDDLTVRIHADAYFAVDDQLIPIAERRVAGTDLDLRDGLSIAGKLLNQCYGDVRVVDGRSCHRLEAPDGRAVELLADESFGYVQVYICPSFPRPAPAGGMGRAIAIEPMTAPPDAFNSGRGLRWVAPGATWTATWGIRLITG